MTSDPTLPQDVLALLERHGSWRAIIEAMESHTTLQAKCDALRGFAQAVMEDWHEGDLDGGTRQDIAERFGLLRAIERFSPCGEACGCSEYFTESDWKAGQTCFRATTLLTGDAATDTAIDALLDGEAASA